MEWPNQICFSNKEITDIQETLQRREGVPIQIEKELSGFGSTATTGNQNCG